MKHFIVEEKGNVVHLKIARGEKYNALNAELLAEFAEAAREVRRSEAQIVLLYGDGEGFCAGGDLSMMKEVSDRDTYDEVMDNIETIVKTFYSMQKIVISALHGPVVGLGLSIALSADYVIAEPDANLSMNFIGIGLAPDGGGHFWLQERLGTHQAKHFAWEGQQMRAKEAYDHKLVDIVVNGPVQEEAARLAQEWSSRPLKSMIATKEIYHQHGMERLSHYLEKERENQWRLLQTADHSEGVEAFLNKRKPEFQGR
ncbi:enoyl-CoA hydratase [Halobacillus litoralis]|uniref:Enoyl-CoA hydratase n=1 Tax=Halobacillus litoralis TaxID=45668 RepID=A0A845FE34_9BACI|nr:MULTISPECIES: enoyl-CoA hydratase [Halobacillus]MEC3883756.1 enoyl-CoA hydratase [Halobacillus sp. HZG1]MYL72048.1 enoyl-CoA hydratase [Halobacillus litoralis]